MLLIHDERSGSDLIGTMARQGRGLPARVLPFAVNETTEIGFDTLGEGVQFFFTLPVSGTASQSAPNGISGG